MGHFGIHSPQQQRQVGAILSNKHIILIGRLANSNDVHNHHYDKNKQGVQGLMPYLHYELITI